MNTNTELIFHFLYQTTKFYLGTKISEPSFPPSPVVLLNSTTIPWYNKWDKSTWMSYHVKLALTERGWTVQWVSGSKNEANEIFVRDKWKRTKSILRVCESVSPKFLIKCSSGLQCLIFSVVPILNICLIKKWRRNSKREFHFYILHFRAHKYFIL